MQILLASAKIMHDKVSIPADVTLTQPRFEAEAEALALDVAQYPAQTLAQMLGCSPAIAAQNHLRFQQFLGTSPKLPAVLAYHGQAYKHLKAETLTVADLQYAQQRLHILSFLYGMLRPLDGIRPYRMEGNVVLASAGGQNLFSYWKSRLTDVLIDSVKADDGVLLHLATEEYQHLFDWARIKREVRVVQPLFYVQQGTQLKMQAVWAKTCRGALTRYVIEHRLTQPEPLTAFRYEGFAFAPWLGDSNYPHFLR